MPKPQKIEAVEKLKDRLSRAKSVVVADYRGMTVAEMTDLRSRLRKENVDFKIVKNRLAKIALRESGIDMMNEHLKGMKAIALGMNDPVSPAKVLAPYAKDNAKLKLVVGLMDKRLLDVNALVELSRLPSREVLLSRMLGSLTSPVQKFAFALNQTAAKVVYALDAVARKKAEQSSAN